MSGQPWLGQSRNVLRDQGAAHHRLCEERSDEAIRRRSTVLAALDRHAAQRRLAMTRVKSLRR